MKEGRGKEEEGERKRRRVGERKTEGRICKGFHVSAEGGIVDHVSIRYLNTDI